MRLIADSGGTSTSWALFIGNQVSYITSQGLHPNVINSDTTLPLELLKHKNKIRQIYFYGTGCAKEEQAEIVRIFLSTQFKLAAIEVYSDLLALAHPAFKNGKGLVGILGTGSSMSYYDGNILHFEVDSKGKGFDPGSGPVIGQIVYQKYKSGKLSQDSIGLFESILTEHVIDEYVLQQINIVLFQNLNNPECYGIVQDALIEYFDFYRPLWSKRYFPIVFGGSIAALGKPILENVMKRKGIQLDSVIRYPIEKLVEYHR